MADLPKPAFIVTVTGRLVETEPTALTFDLPDGRHELCTADQLEAYAAAKVAEERAKWVAEAAAFEQTMSRLSQTIDRISANVDSAIRGTEAHNVGVEPHLPAQEQK